MLNKKEIKIEYNKLIEELEHLKAWRSILDNEEKLLCDLNINKHLFAITILERILEIKNGE